MTEKELQNIMIHHMKDVDVQLDLMLEADYSHEAVHHYRESIRRFRALLYYAMPLLSSKEYLFLEQASKVNFDKTSLIREIDVFEHGYGYYMRRAVIEKLENIKRPLIKLLRENGEQGLFIKLAHAPLTFKEMEGDVVLQTLKHRYAYMIGAFMQDSNTEDDEKSVHSKRMMAKKLKYVNEIFEIKPEYRAELIASLGHFQEVSKKFHDVCVNLRFIGMYEIEDANLLDRLVRDYQKCKNDTELEYTLVCQYMKKVL